MIVLQTTSQTLRVSLATSTSTTQWNLMAVYYDYLPQRSDQVQRFTSHLTTTFNTTEVLAVPAPGADGIVRNITNLNAYNADVSSFAAIIYKIDTGGVGTPLKKQNVSTGQSIWYEDGRGWEVL